AFSSEVHCLPGPWSALDSHLAERHRHIHHSVFGRSFRTPLRGNLRLFRSTASAPHGRSPGPNAFPSSGFRASERTRRTRSRTGWCPMCQGRPCQTDTMSSEVFRSAFDLVASLRKVIAVFEEQRERAEAARRMAERARDFHEKT